jgi:glycosyltransferase involved in cell wall biosynthesis
MYGGEIITLGLMKGLIAQGHEVHFASPPGPLVDRAAEIVPCHLIPSQDFGRNLAHVPRLCASAWRTRLQLNGLVQQLGIDVVHATSLKAMLYCQFVARPTPVVWHHHDTFPHSVANDFLMRWLAARSAVVLTPSKDSKRVAVEAGIDPDRVSVLYSGLDPSAWPQRQPRTGQEDLFRIAMIGEIVKHKGSDLIPELLAALLSRQSVGEPRVEMIVVGGATHDTDFIAALQSRCQTYIDSGSLRFLGVRRDISDLLQTVDVLWMPSRREALGTVILEAMFSGVPVIGAPVGGIPELIIDGETGYLASSPSAAAERIRHLMLSDAWGRLSRDAQRWATSQFAINTAIRRLEAVYEHCCGSSVRTA